MHFILDQLSFLEEIRFRPMMGEYMLYYREKLAAYLCDNRLLVKILPSTLHLLPDAPKESPYPGAKPMLLVEKVDDREFLKTLFEEMYPELPEPKRKKESK